MQSIKQVLKKIAYNNNLFVIVVWICLTIVSLISLISHQSTGPVFIYHFSKEYLALLFIYIVGVILVYLSLLNMLQGYYSKIERILGVIILSVAGVIYIISGAYDSCLLPFAFPIQLLLLILFTLYYLSKAVFFNAVIFSITILFTLKMYDISLFLISKKITRLPGQDLQNTEKYIQTFELYPYTGWHMQSNFHHIGEAPFEKKQPYSDYDIKSGQMGFFIDFNIESPPKKEANEFRIILIGGSGAQGWGGQTNEHMLYKQLEKQLNNKLRDTGKHIRVINLAMAGAITYQNYIALNRWGHFLEPDLILSYSGRNDYVTTVYIEGSDGFQYFNELNGLSIATRGSEFPPALRWIKKIFPNIMTRTNVGVALKIFLSNQYFTLKAREDYTSNRNIDCVSKRNCMEKVAIPLYIHAMKSIKRDFMGIPIMIAWQAITPEHQTIHGKDLGKDYYNKMYDIVKHELNGYMNNQWYFVNIHGMFENNPQQYIDVHLGNEGHRIVASIIAAEIEKIVRNQQIHS